MRIKQIRKEWGLASLLLIIFAFNMNVEAQIHTQFATGAHNNSFSYPILQSIDSNSVLFTYYISNNGQNNDSQIAVRISKTNLAVIDTISFPTPFGNQIVGFSGWFSYNEDHSSTYFMHHYIDTGDFLTFNCYNVNESLEIGTLLFSIEENNRKLWFAEQINNQIIVGYSNARVGYDSLFIKTYDLNGTLQNSRVYESFSATSGQIHIQVGGVLHPVKHPQIEDAFILALPTGNKIFVVDQNTLDTIRTYDTDTLGAYFINAAGYWTRHNDDIHVENDGLVLTGTVHIDPDTNIMTNGFDFQYYEFKQFWDGTFSFRDFGPRDIDNRGYAYGINKPTNTKVIAGAIPFSNPGFGVQEKREVLIYIYDGYGKFDSIYIHGDYNHVPLDILVEDNGDVYISGMYTEAWTTGATHMWLSKIPGVALNMMEQKQINNHLFLYPNPTVETIQIKEVSNFINGSFEIYSQTGVLVKQGIVSHQEIDVSSFVAGVYILTAKNNKGEQFNAIFVKE